MPVAKSGEEDVGKEAVLFSKEKDCPALVASFGELRGNKKDVGDEAVFSSRKNALHPKHRSESSE